MNDFGAPFGDGGFGEGLFFTLANALFQIECVSSLPIHDRARAMTRGSKPPGQFQRDRAPSRWTATCFPFNEKGILAASADVPLKRCWTP